jgi:hypothetical protein
MTPEVTLELGLAGCSSSDRKGDTWGSFEGRFAHNPIRHDDCSFFLILAITEEQTMTAEQSTIHDWLRLIRAEYLEMPGLNLTKRQVQRLWKLEPHMCDVLLDALVASEFLKKTHHEAYVLAGGVVR